MLVAFKYGGRNGLRKVVVGTFGKNIPGSRQIFASLAAAARALLAVFVADLQS